VRAVILKVNSPGGEVLASDEIYNLIANFQETDKEITDKTKKGGGGGSTKIDQARNSAIRSVKNLLSQIKTDWNCELKLEGGNWENKYKSTNDISQIDSYKNQDLDKLERWIATKEVIAKLSSNGLDTSFLGISKVDDLKAIFKNLHGSDITKKKNEFTDKIKDYVDNQKKNKDQEIQKAKELVRDALKNAGLESEVKEILGDSWEDEFLGLSEDSEIDQVVNELIQKILAFADQRNTDIKVAIAKIEKLLKDSGLAESILESNWKNGFSGKNQLEINDEVERLRKIIMDKNKEDGGDGEKKNEKIVADSKTETLNQIKVKLKEGHQKLNLEESEIPVSLFAPYKTLADKLNSLNKTEEINAFNNNLLIAIEKKRKEKLNAIAQAAIAEIAQAIGGNNSLELGELKDYKRIIGTSNDPDDIERKKNKVKKLIDDQKKADQNDEGIVAEPTGKKTPKTSPQAPNKVSLQKVIGITSLIVIPSIIIAMISFRIRQETKARRAKKN